MIIIPIVIILGACAFTVMIVRKPFGKCILPVMIIMTLLVYFSQMFFHTFQVGYAAIILYSLCCIPTILLGGRERRKKFRENYLYSYGLWLFLVIAGLFYLLNRKNYITTDFDEVMHWGVFVKEMMRTGHWYTESPRTIPHSDYPPFLPVWEMIFCHFSINDFSSNICHYALQLFEFTAVSLPAVEQLASKEQKHGIDYAKRLSTFFLVFVFFVICVKACDCQNVISKLHVDYALMIIYGRCLCQIWELKKDGYRWGNVSLLLDLSALVLIKQIGVYLCLTILILYWIVSLWQQPFRCKKKVMISILSAVVPLGIYETWHSYVGHTVEKVSSEQFQISIAGFRDEIESNSGKELLYNFYRAIFEKPIFNSAVCITYLMTAILLLVLFHVIARKSNGEITKRERKIYTLFYLVACICYALVIEIAMLVGFTEPEKAGLACFERYMSTFLLGNLLLPLELLFLEIDRKEKLNTWSVSAFIVSLLFLTNGDNANTFAPLIQTNQELTERKIANNIEKNTDSDDVIYVLMNDNGNPLLSVNYYCDDAILSFDYLSILGGTFNDLGQDFTNPEVVAAEEAKIFTCDCLYIHEVTDAFNEAFRSHNNGEDFEPNTMYRLVDGQVVVKWTY